MATKSINMVKRIHACNMLLNTASSNNINACHINNSIIMMINDVIVAWSLSGLQHTDIACNSFNDSTLEDFIKMYANNEISLKELAHCCSSPSKIFGEYVKDSYISGHDKLIPIVKSALEGCKPAKKIVSEVKNLTYNNTSARIYKNMYITPKMVNNSK